MSLLSDHLTEYMSLLDSMKALVKNYENEFPDFPSMSSLLEKTKLMLEKSKSYSDKNKERFDAEIDGLEKKIKKNEKLINFLDEQQAELWLV